jgi:CopG family nickel-responsive transcriptional regulator
MLSICHFGAAAMQRLTISLDDELAEAFDTLIQRRGYANRSEAVRDLLRRELGESDLSSGTARQCVAVLSYVFDHHERQLSSRLTSLQHDHHNLAIATMHAHISHEDCVETVILRGATSEVKAFAQSVIAETGVRHGQIQLIPVETKARPTRWRRKT